MITTLIILGTIVLPVVIICSIGLIIINIENKKEIETQKAFCKAYKQRSEQKNEEGDKECRKSNNAYMRENMYAGLNKIKGNSKQEKKLNILQ